MKIIRVLETILQDGRYAARIWIKRPGLTIVAIITFALGIAANTVIFSGVYALMLQPLPYPNSERLVLISQVSRQGVESEVSFADFSDWRDRSATLAQMTVFRNLHMNLTENEKTERITGSLVSREFFTLLGGRALIGRIFSEEEFQPGSPRTIILSYVFWQRHFGAEADVVGRSIKLNNEDFAVIGVMPESFQFPFRSKFWVPLESFEKPDALQDRAASYYQILALTKTGVTTEQVAGEISSLMEHSALYRADRQQFAARVITMQESLPGISKYKTPLLVLQFAVIFVLLISSVNLANLLIARNAERRQELTVRLALGAGRLRLIRQLLTESLLLGSAGSLVGFLFGWWGIGALQAAVPARIPGLAEVDINPQVLLFTFSVSLITTLGFGLFPALAASGQDLNESLKTGSSGASSDPRRRRLSKGLMVAEVALAVVLLAASGLMIRTFLNLTAEDPGFDPRRSIALSLALPPAEYPDYESVAAYFDQAIDKIESVPGVDTVGGVTYLPLIGYNPGTDFAIAGQSDISPELAPRADFQPVTSDYFQAMGIPLLRGRPFSDADMRPSPEVVIINDALASRFFSDDDPLGKQIQLLGNRYLGNSLTVVGVVGDVKQFGLHTEPRPEIYLPMYRASMTLIVRAGSSAAGVMPVLRETVQEMDRDRSVFGLRTMEQVVMDSLDRRRTLAWMLGVLASVALVLAAMGIYGVVSNLVSQRTREIGIRMALGAERRDIMRAILKQGVGLVAFGVATGLSLSLAMTRFMQSMLFGVASTDPVTIAGIIVILMTIALLACLVPAGRASRVDPILALRHD